MFHYNFLTTEEEKKRIKEELLGLDIDTEFLFNKMKKLEKKLKTTEKAKNKRKLENRIKRIKSELEEIEIQYYSLLEDLNEIIF